MIYENSRKVEGRWITTYLQTHAIMVEAYPEGVSLGQEGVVRRGPMSVVAASRDTHGRSSEIKDVQGLVKIRADDGAVLHEFDLGD